MEPRLSTARGRLVVLSRGVAPVTVISGVSPVTRPLGLMSMGRLSVRRIMSARTGTRCGASERDLPALSLERSSSSPCEVTGEGRPRTWNILLKRERFSASESRFAMNSAKGREQLVRMYRLGPVCETVEQRGSVTHLRMKTMTQETTICAASQATEGRRRRRGAHRTTDTHLQEQDSLLPRSQAAQVHRRQPAHHHGADTVEERVDKGDLVTSIAGVEDDGEKQRGEGAGGRHDFNAVSVRTPLRHCQTERRILTRR